MKVIHPSVAELPYQWEGSLPLVKDGCLWECLWTPDLPFANIGDISEELQVHSLEKEIQGYFR